MNKTPTAEQVRRRIGLLRGYRWSSYRAYIGLERVPAWLDCEEIHKLGGGSKDGQRRRRYREYVERAIREGLKETPWESVRDQIVLGSQEFLEALRKELIGQGEPAGQRLERMARPRPDWRTVVASVEQVKGENWETFRDRHGDRGRDLALHLARERAGMALSELARHAGPKGDAVVAMCLRRYAARLRSDAKERAQWAKAIDLLNVRG